MGGCVQYKIFRAGDKIDTIVRDFGWTLPDVKALNPQFDWKGPMEVGMPLCVVGSMPNPSGDGVHHLKTVQKGRRPEGLVKYAAAEGDTCLGIMKRANVDMATFVELNPQADCKNLTVVYLPEGTVVANDENPNWPPKETNQDCLVGPWSEWSECSPKSTETRYRTIYQEAAGTGNPCPEAVEIRACDYQGFEDGGRRLAEHQYCPHAHDGCSVGSYLIYYHLFVPACNVHDICYACHNYKTYPSGMSKAWCDFDFYGRMQKQCNYVWSGWWNYFPWQYCMVVADNYFLFVYNIAKDNFKIKEGYKPHLVDDGCHWKPWDQPLNNVAGYSGFHPGWYGCRCDGTSCQYW